MTESFSPSFGEGVAGGGRKAPRRLRKNQMTKVFVNLFQKVADSQGRALSRAPQSAKLSMAFFFCQAFLFAPTVSKRKADYGI
ncbi:MAG: hypothetical protein ACI3XI_06650 [Eubacteriales bacterium]